MNDVYDYDYDAVVVGGGAAGLSAGLTLARARRSVVVVDAGEPRNAPAAAVHGFLGHDGTSPAELLAIGRDEVMRYGGGVVAGTVRSAVAARSVDGDGGDGDGVGFVVALEDGCTVRARRLLLTTGLVDELPDVPGIRERWGHDVLHCPYCHGWEVRDRPIGVLGTDGFAAHQALLFRQWSADVVLFLHTAPPPTDEEAARLAARGITVVRGEVDSLEITADGLSGVRLRSGEVMPRRALAVRPRFVARGELLAGLGLEAVEHPMGVGSFVACDGMGHTAVPGVYAAGNIADPFATVVSSAAAGAMAAAALNADLIEEDARDAVTAAAARAVARSAG